MKSVFLINVFVWLSIFAKTQSKFELKILVENKSSKLSTSIFFKRDTTVLKNYSLVNEKEYSISGRTWNGYGVFDIVMKFDNEMESRAIYFVKQGKGILRVKWDSVNNSIATTKISRNVIPAYDTAVNSFFKGMVAERYSAAEELVKVLNKVNYSKSEFSTACKKVNQKTLEYLGKAGSSYLSFWYFENEVFGPAITYLENDTSYLRRIRKMLTTFYGARFSSLTSYHRMAVYLDRVLSRKLKAGDIAPGFKQILDLRKNNLGHKSENSFMILDFWASWCGPCLAQIPATKDLVRRLREDSIDIEIVGISMDKSEEVMRKTIQKYGIDWINILDQNGKIASDFRVLAIPFLVLIDEKGRILYISDGSNEIEMIERFFKR